MEFSRKELARAFPELTRNLPSTEEIIRAIGLQYRRPGSDVASSVALFGAGVLVGAGLALLFAPTSGRELREELGERASELKERATHAAGTATETRHQAF